MLNLEVICSKNQMTVNAEFNSPFQGSIFSKGTYGQDKCVYVNPYSGITRTSFNIPFDGCGTKPDLNGKFYENTIVVQYGTDIIEAWDEAKRLRCEWYDAYEKPAAQNTIQLSDLDVVELNFHGDSIDCWMEIQEGKGPWSREVSGIVPLGSPLTMVIAIKDKDGQFDMRVKSCFAHDGVKPPVHLTDEHGCVLKPKLLSPFMKIRDYNNKASVVSYSYFYAFKFPDTMEVHIQCSVEVCRYGCPDTCQKIPPIPRDPSLKRPEVQQQYGYQGMPQQHYYPPVHQQQSYYPPIQPQQQNFPPAQDFYVPFGQPALPPPQQEKKPSFFQYAASVNRPNSVPPPPQSNDTDEDEPEPQAEPTTSEAASSSQTSEQVTALNDIKQNEDYEKDSKHDTVQKIGEHESSNKQTSSAQDQIKIQQLHNIPYGIQHNSESQIRPNRNENQHSSSHQQQQNNYPESHREPSLSQSGNHQQNNQHQYQQSQNSHPVRQEVTILVPQLVQSAPNEANRHPQESQQAFVRPAYPEQANVRPQITATVHGDNIEPLPMPHALPGSHTLPTIVFGVEIPQPPTHPYNRQPGNNRQPTGPGQRHGEVNPHLGPRQNIPGLHMHGPPYHGQPNLHGMPSYKPEHNQFQQIPPHPSQQQNKQTGQPPHPNHQQLSNQVASVLYKPPPPHYPYPVPQFVPNVAVLNILADRSDSSEALNHQASPLPAPHLPQPPQKQFPHGPRSLRIRRDIADGQQFGVSQTFRAIGASDLDFAPNTTMRTATIYKGRREDIVYGVCVPAMTLAVGLGILLLLITSSLCTTGYLLFKYCMRKRQQDGSKDNMKLSAIFLNGRFQYFYKNRKSNT